MKIDINEEDLKKGLLGLVIALVEIIRDALKIQAIRRMDENSLKEDEVERLGIALQDLDRALEAIKSDHGIDEAVESFRGNLDCLVDDLLDEVLDGESDRTYRAEFSALQAAGKEDKTGSK